MANESKIERIKSFATELSDVDLLKKIANLTSKRGAGLLYHQACGSNYDSKYRLHLASNEEKTDSQKKREISIMAFEDVCDYIEETVVEEKKPCSVEFLKQIYIDKLTSESNASESLFTASHLEEKLLKKMDKKIKIGTIGRKKIVMPFNASKLSDEDKEDLENREIISRGAMLLRKRILDLVEKYDPKNGEFEIPADIIDFFKTILCGFDVEQRNSKEVTRLAESMAQDVIYAITDGKIKPKKHIELGLSLQKLKNGSEIVDMMNALGHCCSNSELKEVKKNAARSGLDLADMYKDLLESSDEDDVDDKDDKDDEDDEDDEDDKDDENDEYDVYDIDDDDDDDDEDGEDNEDGEDDEDDKDAGVAEIDG